MKKIIMGLAFLAMTGIVKGQEYYHAFGLQANIGLQSEKYETETESSSVSQVLFVPGVFYKATLAFEINRDMSFAVSAYPFIGMMGSLNSQSGATSGTSIGIEFPILGELYFGDLDDACFFVGAGINYSRIASTYGRTTVLGPQIELGGQFEFRDQIIGARLAYTYGVNNATDNPDYTMSNSIINVGIFYPIGL